MHSQYQSPGQSPSRRKNAGKEEEESEEMVFKYYGRHGNQWLFNDFSVTDAVGRRVRRVFSKEKGEEDWFERREG